MMGGQNDVNANFILNAFIGICDFICVALVCFVE